MATWLLSSLAEWASGQILLVKKGLNQCKGILAPLTPAGVAQVISDPAMAAVFTIITRSEVEECRSMLVTTPPVRSTRASGR